ncbi:MAG TPA: hypothetical protein VMV92_27745 [Streptosporangiaceae bacterium]|nr:hypothetical protein [Streptosporangiaceae bacterium]
MNNRDPAGHVQDSIIVGGNVTGNVQNVKGYRASAVNNQDTTSIDQQKIQDLIGQVRALLEASQYEPDDAAEYNAALATVEADVADPKRNRFSIRGAMQVLSGAAGLVTGWADAVTALQHALDKL